MFGRIFGKRKTVANLDIDVLIARLVMFFDIQLRAKKIKLEVAPHEVKYVGEYIFLDAVHEALAKSGCSEIRDLSYEQQRDLHFVSVAVFVKDGKFGGLLDHATKPELEKVEQIRERIRQLARYREADLSGTPRGQADRSSVPDGSLKARLQWQKKDPKLWHSIVFDPFHDSDLDAYEWIVHQPQCDTATALMIFHLFNSFECLEYADEAMAEAAGKALSFRIAKTVCDRWAAKSFKTFSLDFCKMGYEATEESYVRAVERARERFGAPPFVPASAFFHYHKIVA